MCQDVGTYKVNCNRYISPSAESKLCRAIDYPNSSLIGNRRIQSQQCLHRHSEFVWNAIKGAWSDLGRAWLPKPRALADSGTSEELYRRPCTNPTWGEIPGAALPPALTPRGIRTPRARSWATRLRWYFRHRRPTWRRLLPRAYREIHRQHPHHSNVPLTRGEIPACNLTQLKRYLPVCMICIV